MLPPTSEDKTQQGVYRKQKLLLNSYMIDAVDLTTPLQKQTNVTISLPCFSLHLKGAYK